ncbi:MAG: signal peptidase I [Anaerolineae bacterium]|nr:signal peptidase I [Anaerolineae bacterium]
MYFACFGIFILALVVLLLAAFWKLFTKADQPGWASLIPIYNVVILLKMIGRPAWYVIFVVIPGLNIYLAVLLVFGLARSFGKGPLFAIGLIFLAPILLPVLAFGKSEYIGPMGPSYRYGPKLPQQ